jgi:hypothetical protein
MIKKKEDEKKDENNNDLKKLFEDLIDIFEYYLDDIPENYVIYSLWTIGVQFHEQFITYPYLFINAIKGSGKSRLLRLISEISDGKFTTAITEAGLYRTKGLLCIDETESLHSKEKQALREILNSSYKKGQKIIRMKKTKSKSEEKFEAEELETYRPIALANIYGMDDILGDRCITRILEKSDDGKKTKIIEDYTNDKNIIEIKKLISNIKEKNNFKFDGNIFQEWNDFIKNNHKTKNFELFSKLKDTEINGRNLELFFPLLVIALNINEKIFDFVLEICNKISIEKKDKDFYESTDVKVYEFISELEENENKLFSIKKLLSEFKNKYEIYEDWTNPKWFSRELHKLNLVLEQKRSSEGYLMKLNIKKAKEKLGMFKK